MAQKINRLNVKAVASQLSPGLHADGGGLYLRVSQGKNSGKRWVFIYRRPRDGKRTEIGFGSAADVSLKQARDKRAHARLMLADRLDPKLERTRDRETILFGEFADQYLDKMEPQWRNSKHRAQWRMTLTRYAAPLRDIPINQVSTSDVLSVLEPIWLKIPETASRLRGRIEKVLDAAKAQGLRSGENPAMWRGHLQHHLRPRQKLTRGHHAAMQIDDVPNFMLQLRNREAIAARCLEFCILTAARSGEALGARWQEIDRKSRIWILPPDRMLKTQEEHRVPLSDRAIELLDEMDQLRKVVGESAFIFPGQRRDRPLSVMALTMVLRRMGRSDVTAHGFRSTFRDWAGDYTSFPRELAESALSHREGNKVEQAYRRSDALNRRRELMQAWADYCAGHKGNVISLIAVRQ